MTHPLKSWQKRALSSSAVCRERATRPFCRDLPGNQLPERRTLRHQIDTGSPNGAHLPGLLVEDPLGPDRGAHVLVAVDLVGLEGDEADGRFVKDPCVEVLALRNDLLRRRRELRR